MPTTALRPMLAAALLTLTALAAVGQDAAARRSLHWVGGDGAWDDAAHWSLVAGGIGGAGVPRAADDAVIAPAAPARVRVDGTARCRSLRVDGTGAFVEVQGPRGAELRVHGDLVLRGSVRWALEGCVRMAGAGEGRIIDAQGIPMAGELCFDGAGSWSVLSDLRLERGDLIWRSGTVHAAGALLQARTLCSEGRGGQRLMAGSSVIRLERLPEAGLLERVVEPQRAVLVVDGAPVPLPRSAPAAGDDRDAVPCATGPGQTPFLATTSATTDFHGYNVRCRGECNAAITVSVSGGVGPFTYSWLNGGPATATWIGACGGPQIVIVTDVGQNVSCGVTLNVTEPSPLGVIFFGPGTPPACADVCNGMRTAIAVGGVSPYAYDWNNGAGNGSSFSQLCAGANTLRITDANGCTRDTTFFFDVQPIQPNLSFTGTSCNGTCDGEASVNPTGGTGAVSATWAPPPGAGQGTYHATGLCAGDFSVLLVDANGCDTTLHFTIAEPPPILVDASQADASCFGDCDGTATAVPSGGAGPYAFQWSPEPGGGQGTATATGLCAGPWSALITDLGTGCTATQAFTIGSPPAIEVQGTVTDATCADACDGAIDLAVSGVVPPYTITWLPDVAGQGTPHATGLCPGTYAVTVAVPSGCDTTVSFTVAAPPPVIAALTKDDASCAGACDGSASVSASGGTPGYTYLWMPDVTGQGTPSATGLCAGSYTVRVADANGCDTLIAFFIDEPPPLAAVPTQADVTCGGLCNGTASVAVSGGTPGYTYAWSPDVAGQGTPDATGLCAGSYSVLITDANGCAITQAFTIHDAVPIQASLQALPASCPGECDGSASVIATGGQAPYSYDWQPPPGAGQGTPDATGLCAQAYALTITDAAGCDTLIAFTVPAPPPIMAAGTAIAPSCGGGCDGSITVQATGGNGTFTYLWTPDVDGQGTPHATQLCAGTYSVLIGSGSCDTTLTFQLTAPPPIDAALTATAPSCAGDCDGTASVAVAGGTAPYGYHWMPDVAGQGTPNASGLCPGSYSVQVSDAAGCDTLIHFTIDAPLPITAALDVTPASCGGGCEGTATAAVSGGTAPYQYDWQPPPGSGQGTPSAAGLCPGPYTLTVTDANGCEAVMPFAVSTPSGIDAQFTSTPTGCGSACDATATVTATGGVPPYAWLWTPEPGGGQGTPQATGLCQGIYTVQISDAALCDTVIQLAITGPAPIEPNAVQTNETCNGPCDGTASVSPTGGVAPYAFAWDPPPPVGDGTPAASGLCAGTWTVTITDAAGCDTMVVFDIHPKDPVMDHLVWAGATCPGTCDGTAQVAPSGGTPPYTIAWTPDPPMGQQGAASVTGLCLGLWGVTVTDANGCASSTPFFVDAPPPISAGLVVLPETCAGPCTGSASVSPAGGTGSISAHWSPEPGGGQGTYAATGLCAGIAYSVTLTDDGGCDSTFTFTVDPFTAIEPNSSATPVSCAGACDGTATVNPTGGAAPYAYAWSPGGQDSQSITGLCEGAYAVTITDADGCSTDATVLVTGPPPIDAGAVVTPVSCNGQCDGTIVLNASGGAGGFTYAWTPPPPNGQGHAQATGLCAGTWTVAITDGSGCQLVQAFDLAEPAPLTLAVTTTPSECQVCIGTATAAIGGGTGLLSVEWHAADGSLVGTGTSIAGLCAGVYTAVLADASGCSVQQAAPIGDNAGEDITMTDGATSCPNACDGSVSVSFTCADPPCTIAWFDAQGNDLNQAGAVLAGLCSGDYLVQVTNASGCVSIASAAVSAPAPTQLLISSSAASCGGACDGLAAVGVSGGTPPYTFTWSPAPGAGQGTPLATGLCAGIYTVLIGDGGGCDTTAQVLITEPMPLDAGATVTGITCAGQCDGSIALAPTGGTAPYTATWNPVPPVGQGVLTATGLCAGAYAVTIADANGCTFSATYGLAAPQPLQVILGAVQSTCPNCDGEATASISGGTAPYAVAWSIGGMPVGTGDHLTGLCGGLYTATVTDAHGCSATATVQVGDSDAEAVTATGSPTSCGNSCDGSVSAAFVCTAPPCALTWFDAGGSVIAVNQGIVDGLCAGTYTVQVTNGNGCVSFDDATVAPAQQISVNLSSVPVSCAGACDGIATAGPFNGQPPYTWFWSPAPGSGQGTPQATDLCPGVYTVLITDAAQCDTTVQVLILEPQPLAATGAVQGIQCAGDCSGAVDATVTGGTAPYAYAWSPEPASGQGTASISGLCAGTWTLAVTDASGCQASAAFTVDEPLPLQLSVSAAQSHCGLCDGSAAASVSGGTAPYFITWMSGGAIIGTGDAISGLCAGFYQVQVADAHGCATGALAVVSDVDGEQIAVADGITSCPGACDGEVSVAFTCSQDPCTIGWFDAAGNDLGVSSNTMAGLCAGPYYVQVTNGIGCVTIDTAWVAEPDPIVANLSTVPATCAGYCDGSATVGPSGGQGPYQILWSPGGETDPQVTGLCAGTYSVAITDQAGCSITQDVLIPEPQPLSVTAAIDPVTCNGACDGGLTAVASGGTQPYAYLWSPAPPGDPAQPAITGLCAGDWTVTVTDGNGCTTAQTFTLDEPAVLDVQVATTDNACYGDCQGMAYATVAGGAAPYAIVWRDAGGNAIGQGDTGMAGLCAGDYTVEVTDAHGCALTVPFSITQGDAIEAGLLWTDETCFGPCDGTAAIAPSGGIGPYSITWTDASGAVIAQDVTAVGGLCAGTHAVTIVDAIGCDTMYAFTIQPYTDIADGATVADVQCNGACDGSIVLSPTGGTGGLSYAWSPVPPNGPDQPQATSLCPGTYALTITDGAGCSAAFSYAISEPPALALAMDQVMDASCADAQDGAISVTASGGTPAYAYAWSGPNGFQSAAEDLTGLAPGGYALTVTDAHGCTATLAATVDALSTVVADAGIDLAQCAGSAFVLDGSQSVGAVTYQWLDDRGEVVGTDAVLTLTGLGEGTHTFTLVVADGPCSSADQVTVTVLASPIADAGPDLAIFLSETAPIGGSPTGPPGSVFQWQPDSLLSDGTAANPIADPPATTWFTVLVTAPNGCSALDSMLLTVVPEVVIPTGFTPNSDGWNDAWVIDHIDLFPDCEVEVYNRWGDMLFRSVGYKTPWDGRYAGGFVPVGTYYYVIKLNDPRFPDAYTGPLTVIR